MIKLLTAPFLWGLAWPKGTAIMMAEHERVILHFLGSDHSFQEGDLIRHTQGGLVRVMIIHGPRRISGMSMWAVEIPFQQDSTVYE